jgi:hypothetical protein
MTGAGAPARQPGRVPADAVASEANTRPAEHGLLRGACKLGPGGGSPIAGV